MDMQNPLSDTRSALRERVLERRQRAAQKRRNRFLLIRVLSFVVVLGAWQIYGLNTIDLIFSPFTDVIAHLYQLLVYGPLAAAIVYSVSMFLGGLVIGSIVGILLGVAMGRFAGFEAAVGMYVYAIYSTPLVALIPLISLWFGFGIEAQLIIISMFVLFPVTIAVYNGVRNVDASLTEVARSFRANEMAMWRHVIIPSVVPYIVTGVSQGVAMGLVGMFISEIYTALSGMGQVLAYSANSYKTADMLAVLLTVMVLGVFFRAVIEKLRKRLAPWFNTDTGR
ncbi:MAG: ABC transporter permease subunit [Rhodobacteraceae bacterium]|nr:ABC transporter permease subunit [Paracoccaceae bacterium]